MRMESAVQLAVWRWGDWHPFLGLQTPRIISDSGP
jgi:hypothetical protein